MTWSVFHNSFTASLRNLCNGVSLNYAARAPIFNTNPQLWHYFEALRVSSSWWKESLDVSLWRVQPWHISDTLD